MSCNMFLAFMLYVFSKRQGKVYMEHKKREFELSHSNSEKNGKYPPLYDNYQKVKGKK